MWSMRLGETAGEGSTTSDMPGTTMTRRSEWFRASRPYQTRIQPVMAQTRHRVVGGTGSVLLIWNRLSFPVPYTVGKTPVWAAGGNQPPTGRNTGNR